MNNQQDKHLSSNFDINEADYLLEVSFDQKHTWDSWPNDSTSKALVALTEYKKIQLDNWNSIYHIKNAIIL